MELLAVLAVPLSSAHYIRSHFPRKRGQLPLRQFPPQPMTITFIQYIIVCPLVFLAGFVDAIAGGGGLISLPAYMLAGLPVHNAIGTNKLSSAMGETLNGAVRKVRLYRAQVCNTLLRCGAAGLGHRGADSAAYTRACVQNNNAVRAAACCCICYEQKIA